MPPADSSDWTPLLLPLSQAQSVQEFALLLTEGVLNTAQAHGVRVCLLNGEVEAAPLSELGRGLALCDPGLGAQAAHAGGHARHGMHEALLLGPLLLDVVGGEWAGGGTALEGLLALAPILGLAFEGVQAREARRGTGREQETMTRLVRRMGGSLDLPQLLQATAETAA